MSIFASYLQVTIPIPFDPPHTVTVRKLTGRQIENAQEAHRDTLASGSARSWATLFRRMLEKGGSDEEVRAAIADALTGYDRYALVKSGLVAWSYPQAVEAKATDDLDDEAIDFIAREVLRLTKPALFVETVEEAEKNASGPSIDS